MKYGNQIQKSDIILGLTLLFYRFIVLFSTEKYGIRHNKYFVYSFIFPSDSTVFSSIKTKFPSHIYALCIHICTSTVIVQLCCIASWRLHSDPPPVGYLLEYALVTCRKAANRRPFTPPLSRVEQLSIDVTFLITQSVTCDITPRHGSLLFTSHFVSYLSCFAFDFCIIVHVLLCIYLLLGSGFSVQQCVKNVSFLVTLLISVGYLPAL